MSDRLDFCRRANRYLLAGVAVIVLPVACSPGYFPPPAPVAASGASQAQLAMGHDLHRQQCAACHAYVDPAMHSAADLKQDIMPRMAAKAKLTASEQQAVLAYLLAVRKP